MAIILLLFCISCSSGNTDEIKITDATNQETTIESKLVPDPNRPWNLTWEDNFDDDFNLWNIWEGGAFNEEIQLYKPEQLKIENSILTITVKREDAIGNTTPFNTTQKDFSFISGRVETKTMFGPSSGNGESEYRFMARIKMPSGNGMWPAFWSYGAPWPTQGEIDIIEARGNLPNEFSSNIFYGTQNGIPLTRLEDTVVEHELKEDITADFHIYELIWTATSLEIKFDNRSLHVYTANSKNYIASLFNKKQQIVLNTAVGGAFFPNTNSSNFVDDSQMAIDWVRVYKR